MTERADDPRESAGNGRGAVIFITVGAIVLGAIHLDLWWWDDGTLHFGFLPTGLAFHVLFSLLAAALWATACVIAWPKALEVPDDPSAGAPLDTPAPAPTGGDA